MRIRKAISSGALLAFLVSTTPGHAFAQALLPPEPVRTALPSADESSIQLFGAYPNGGPELTARIADAVVDNPNIAHELVAYIRGSPTLTKAQRVAAEQGLVEALGRLRATNLGDGDFRWGWVALLAALIGIGIWVSTSGDDNDTIKGKKVSPN